MCLFIASWPAALSAAPKPRVAILDFRANNTASSYADVVRDILEVRLYRTNAFDIVERNQIDVILKEQGIEDRYCSDTGCAVRIGKILSVDTVVIGSVNKVGKFTITIKFVNVKEGIVEYADSEVADLESVIESTVNTLADRSAANAAKGKEAEHYISGKSFPAEYYFRGIIPGWAQFYSGHTIKGYAFLGGFLLAGSFAVWAYYDYTGKKDDYNHAKLGTSGSEFDRKYSDYRTATYTGRASLGILAAVYAVHWIDVIVFSRPVTLENSGATNFGNIYYSYNYKYDFMAHESKMSLESGIRF
jgi:hypothetical protein